MRGILYIECGIIQRPGVGGAGKLSETVVSDTVIAIITNNPIVRMML